MRLASEMLAISESMARDRLAWPGPFGSQNFRSLLRKAVEVPQMDGKSLGGWPKVISHEVQERQECDSASPVMVSDGRSAPVPTSGSDQEEKLDCHLLYTSVESVEKKCMPVLFGSWFKAPISTVS